MNFPLISEYVEAIRHAEDNFDSLSHLRPVLDNDGNPVMSSGNFAVVFKMTDGAKDFAIKCFTREQEGRAEAYRQIAEELEFVSSSFLCSVKYYDNELFVDANNCTDSEFPVLLMEWVEGKTLDNIGKHGIELYGCYSADEVHILCEDQIKRGIPLGTQYINTDKLSLVFVTTNKSDKDYSPSTLYKDYAINEKQFHWQSKNDIRIDSAAGQRFMRQKENGWNFLLFVRDSKKDEFGNTNGYHCLGLMDFNKSEGECPMNITWDMRNNIPGVILQKTQAI